LEVSTMLIQGRHFDTLWIERPLTFSNGYDSSVAFIDTSLTHVYVIRTDVNPHDTVHYQMSSVDTRAWLPKQNLQDTARLVVIGGRYHLEAHVNWDRAREYPSEHEMHMDTLRADAYVQKSYAISDTAWVPLEALHPSLSLGLPAKLINSSLADQKILLHLFDSLSSIYSFSKHSITISDFKNYLSGGLVLRPLLRGDTAFYIFDNTKVPDPNVTNPDPISRYSRQWKFIQKLYVPDFGGLAIGYAYDTTRARIIDPQPSPFQSLTNKNKVDTAGLYQRGHTRFLGITASTQPGVSGYPDTLSWGNRNLGYTGRDVIYFYAVDSMFVEYNSRTNPGFSFSIGGNGGGGGNRRAANNSVHYSNIMGGDGYFSAAAVDSFVVNLIAVKDTVPIAVTHSASILRDDRRN